MAGARPRARGGAEVRVEAGPPASAGGPDAARPPFRHEVA